MLDTNVFVAAGFNPGSQSARLFEAVRDRRLRMVWNEATHAEIEHVMHERLKLTPKITWLEPNSLPRSEHKTRFIEIAKP